MGTFSGRQAALESEIVNGQGAVSLGPHELARKRTRFRKRGEAIAASFAPAMGLQIPGARRYHRRPSLIIFPVVVFVIPILVLFFIEVVVVTFYLFPFFVFDVVIDFFILFFVVLPIVVFFKVAFIVEVFVV